MGNRSPFDDASGVCSSLVPTLDNLFDLGSPEKRFRNLYVSDQVNFGTETADAYLLTDGSDKNYSLSVYAAGTAYSLTNTPAPVDFGTIDPVVTLNKAGTYLLMAQAVVEYNGATFGANQDVTLKLRRTNNTAADLSNSSVVVPTEIVTTLDGLLATINLPTVIYTTTNLNDAISLFGSVGTAPSAGSLDVTAASIVAVRLY